MGKVYECNYYSLRSMNLPYFHTKLYPIDEKSARIPDHAIIFHFAVYFATTYVVKDVEEKLF